MAAYSSDELIVGHNIRPRESRGTNIQVMIVTLIKKSPEDLLQDAP